MTDPVKQNIMKYWPLVLGVLTIIVTYVGMRSHMSDSTLHKDETEHILTDEEYKDFLEMKTTFKLRLETVTQNEDKIIKIESDILVHECEYNFLLLEHNDLEEKVSRIHKELKEDILNK